MINNYSKRDYVMITMIAVLFQQCPFWCHKSDDDNNDVAVDDDDDDDDDDFASVVT